MLSRSILNLQLNCLLEKSSFLKEVQEEFRRVKEFQLLSGLVRSQIKEFKKVGGQESNFYQVKIERDKEVIATANVTIPMSYPECPPIFTISMSHTKLGGHRSSSSEVLQALSSKMDLSDLRSVNALSSASACPDAPTLELLLDELHSFYPDFCDPRHRDLLLSFQLRKLLNCLDTILDTSSTSANPNDGGAASALMASGLFKVGVKGRFKKRPFAFNKVQNLLEQK